MSSVAEVQEEIVRYYGGDKLNTPPLVFVEWKSTSPIEIELIAWGGDANADAVEPLEFLAAPGLKPSPLFSRVARVHRGGTIFLGDIYGPGKANAAAQTEASFERLKLLLEKTGSDLTHLAKATYYVTDDEISKAHNEVRPKHYDPERPPAASKAMVGGTGRAGVRYVMDMIAVPSSRGTPASKPEVGYKFRANDAADGWINLFDGETTFGWKDARVENGVLSGGELLTPLPRCAVRMEFTKPGTEQVDFKVGGKTVSTKSGMASIVEDMPGGKLEIDADVAIKSLDIRPLELKPLWNGRDLTGWQPIGRQGVAKTAEPQFHVENGALRVVGGPAALEYTGEKFANLVVQIDVRTRAVHSNGGLFLRAIPGQFMNGYEAQLHNRCLDGDAARTFKYATGGLDDRRDARRLVSRDFETFRLTVIASGPHFATWVNGRQMTSWTDDRPPHENPRQGLRLEAGAIQIQAHDPATDYEVRQILTGAIELPPQTGGAQ
jgi:enamine deaminase RidA (YjgF/YER057c/UK114 family)